MSEEKSSAGDVCACCRHKSTPRDTVEQKNLQNRINRIIGQLKGIQGMIEDNRYCGDVMLKEHMMTCVAEGVQQGNTEILEEAVELMKKLK